MAAPTRLRNNRTRVMIPPPSPVCYLGLNVLDFNLPCAENSDHSGVWPLAVVCGTTNDLHCRGGTLLGVSCWFFRLCGSSATNCGPPCDCMAA
jgi:hypothetical protein